MTWEEIVRLYRITRDQPPRNVQPHYNICPTDPVDVVVANEGKRTLIRMRWGLVPNWWGKQLKEMKVATFNARAETVAEKPMFRESIRAKVLPDARLGLLRMEEYTARQATLLLYAARWSAAHLRRSLGSMARKPVGTVIKSCTMVITEPNRLAAEIHDRMPVILESKDFEQWEKGDQRGAAALMKSAGDDVLQRWPVSKRVNSSKAPTDDASLIDIEGEAATSAEIMAATISLAHELGQFGDGAEV